MTKTTNILDLNNRLEKVEKENVVQNSYTSLKNKPKINNVTLTGNKSSSDLGLAAAGDITGLQTKIGDLTTLTTTDKSSVVAAINENYIAHTIYMSEAYAKTVLNKDVRYNSACFNIDDCCRNI